MDRAEIKPGNVFGMLTVLKYHGKSRHKHKFWLCKCICGNEKIIRERNFVTGITVSCGCYGRNMKTRLTHGLSKTRIYRIWNLMLYRCNNRKHIGYDLYGGRGIKVCNEWLNFMVFYDWANANGYADNLTIDRINNNGNYEPGNCRWVTNKKNSNNKRTNRNITIDGETKSMKQWAEKMGVNYEALKYRLDNGLMNYLFDKNTHSHLRNRDSKGRFVSDVKSS